MALPLPKPNRAFVDAESVRKVLLRHPGEGSGRAQLKACYEIVRSMTHHCPLAFGAPTENPPSSVSTYVDAMDRGPKSTRNKHAARHLMEFQSL